MLRMAFAPVDPDGAALWALRSAGLRVTMPRLAMLAWLDPHPHSTAEAITAGVRGQFGAVSTQAVYNMLAACTVAGLLRRIEPAGHPTRFERRAGDNHHHVVCHRCDRTEDVDCVAGGRPCCPWPMTWASRWTRPRWCSGACAPPATQLKAPRMERGTTRRNDSDRK
jgi:Fur family transcriptional regulator, stress-responsive regulator